MAHQSSFGEHSKDKSTFQNGGKNLKNLPPSIVSLYSSDSCVSDEEDEETSRTAEGSVSEREERRKFLCKNRHYESTESYGRRKERCYRKRSRSKSKSNSPERNRSQPWNVKGSTESYNHQQEYVYAGEPIRTKIKKAEVLAKDDDIELKKGSVQSESSNHIVLPSYYNRKKINPKKYAEQMRKRKLLWGKKVKDDDDGGSHEQQTSSVWQEASFSGDENGKTTAKFKRLMGIRSSMNDDASQAKRAKNDQNKKHKEIFDSMESQYEAARIATHTQRGVGLGFRTFPFHAD